MDDSIAQAQPQARALQLPAWKTLLSASCAVALYAIFLVSGVWKLVDPFAAAARMIQAKVPSELGMAAALGVGIAETFAGVLLMVPRFRRWGAWLAGVLLIVFMVYIGYYYRELTGEDCSCFPWLKRAVGPGFFIGDAIMLVMALIAGLWTRRPESTRGAVIALGAICVFAFAMLGVSYARQSGAKAPATITADGQPYSLQTGRQYLYFFDPECSHCYMAAKAMAGYRWKNTDVVVIPTVNPQFAAGFLSDTGLKAKVSNDLDVLKKAFPFGDPPFAVAVENGRQQQSFIHFENGEPETSLRKLGFIE